MKRVNPLLRRNLSIWGDWMNEGIKGMGYPRETTISRLTTSPGRSTFMMVIPRYFSNKVALEVHQFVQKLRNNLQDVLILHYATKAKPELGAEAMHLSKNDYEDLIQYAEQELANLLNLRYYVYTTRKA